MLLTICTFSSAQESLKILAETGVKLTGNVSVIVENINIHNEGTITGIDESSLEFTGNSNNELSAQGSYLLRHLIINKSASNWLRLKQHIYLSGQLKFQSGLLDLDNFSIDLGSLGSIFGETESSRAFTVGDGFLRAETDHGKAGEMNPGNLGATIYAATAMGITEVKRGHSIATITGTANSIRRWYNINPANNTGLNATLNASYFDAELNNLDEQQLSFWKSSDNINWTHEGSTTRNITTNTVELNSIQSFSSWTLAHMPFSNPCNVSVTIPDAYAMVQGVPPNTVFLGYPGANSITLTSVVTGGSAPVSYSWKNVATNTLVGIIATLTIQPTENTTYSLTVTDANGCTATTSKTISVIDARCGNKGDKVPVCLNGPKPKTICVSPNAVEALLQNGATLGPCGSNTITRITQNVEKEVKPIASLSAHVMPNPASEFFNIIINGKTDELITLRITDNAGRLIEIKKGVAAMGVIKIGSNYRPGVYLAEVIQGSERITLKLIKGVKSF